MIWRLLALVANPLWTICAWRTNPVDLSERIRRYMAAAPAAVSGSGGHQQTFAVARALVHGIGLSVEEARPFLCEYNTRCEPPWSERALEHKLRSADRTPDSQGRARGWLLRGNTTEQPAVAAGGPPRNAPAFTSPEPPAFESAKLTAFAGAWRERISRTWLANRSQIEPSLVSAADFLSVLYNAGEHVVVFTDQRSQGQCLWPGEELPAGGSEGVWFLAQPTDGRTHYNPRTGGHSRRSEESVLAWRFLVLESDTANARDWLGALVQFPLRIAAIYTSGGRSIHALVRLDAPSKTAWDRERDALKRPLVILGADPRALSAVRLTRLPGCRRGERAQRLLYLNPEPAAAPICELPPLRGVAAA